jgi:hypothetical protein
MVGQIFVSTGAVCSTSHHHMQVCKYFGLLPQPALRRCPTCVSVYSLPSYRYSTGPHSAYSYRSVYYCSTLPHHLGGSFGASPERLTTSSPSALCNLLSRPTTPTMSSPTRWSYSLGRQSGPSPCAYCYLGLPVQKALFEASQGLCRLSVFVVGCSFH